MSEFSHPKYAGPQKFFAEGVHRDDASCIARESGKQRVLFGRELGGRAVGTNDFGIIEVDRAGGERKLVPVRVLRIASPENGADAQKELLGQKRLYEIVVRSQGKPGKAVFRLIFCREKHEGEAGVHRAHFARERKSVPVWKHDVQKRKVGMELLELRQGLGVVGGEYKIRVTRILQDRADERADFRRVVYHEQAFFVYAVMSFHEPILAAANRPIKYPRRKVRQT